MSMLDDATIEEARRKHSLASMISRRVQLRRAGRGWSGLCPFHEEKTPSFAVYDDKGFYHCFGCGAHGDAIRWVREIEGCGFRDAVQRLLGGQLPSARTQMSAPKRDKAQERVDVVTSSHAGRWIWQTSGPARGEIVENWLMARSLDPSFEPLPGCPAIDRLRFHPRCPLGAWRVDQDPAEAWRTAPAMVNPILDGDGFVRAVQVTYLSPDGRSKALLPKLQDGSERPTRKVFGKVARRAIILSPPEAITDPSLPLIVGEGFETTWSYAQQFGRPCRAAAAVSLGNLQGGAKRLSDGSLPLWDIACDPAVPPFLIDRAGEVIVLIDADMKPLREQRVQLERGAKPVKADIDGAKRAEMCASLAVQAWRRAGAYPVRAVRPRMGLDFNDAARAA
jgi:DNA primase